MKKPLPGIIRITYVILYVVSSYIPILGFWKLMQSREI